MVDDANSLIMGSGAPGLKFPTAGTKYAGQILGLDVMHARKFGSHEPDFWPDGRAKMQSIIRLQTDERDPSIENDNGIRNLYVSSKGIREAIAAAVRKAGASGLAIGGTLKIKYTRDGEGKNAANPPKVYAALYELPVPGEQPEEPDEYAGIDEYDDASDAPF